MPNIGLVQRCIGTNRRHICFVTETYPPEINGVALTLARLLQGLAVRGHIVSMIRPYQRDFDCIATDSSVTLVRGLPLPGYNGLQFGLPAGGLLKRLWTKQPPDVVYVATEGPLGWSAVRTARRLNIAALSGFHTNYHSYSRHYRLGCLQPLVFRYLRYLHNGTRGTIVPSLDLRDRLAGSLIPAFEPVRDFCREIMQRKHDDHVASHSNLINQFFHLLSSSAFIVCYIWGYFDLTKAMCLGLASLSIRQFGHAILEPPCHDKERALWGFSTRDKSLLVASYLLIPIIYLMASGSFDLKILSSMIPIVAHLWFFLTLAVVSGHVALLGWKYDFRSSMVWLVKLVTDPLTDIAAYYTSVPRLLQLWRVAQKEIA